MTLLMMIFRKMFKNLWLMLCMFLGLVVSVALISSIPIYTQAVLQKSLIKDMENYQKVEKLFPGGYYVSYSASTDPIRETIKELEKKNESVLENPKVKEFFIKNADAFIKQDKYIKGNLDRYIGLPVLARFYNYAINTRSVQSQSPTLKVKTGSYASLQSISDLQNHIKLVDGRMPVQNQVDGVYEVLVTDRVLEKLDIVLNQVLILNDTEPKWGIPPIKVKPVGVFTVKDSSDPFWSLLQPDAFNDSFIIDESILFNDFIKKNPESFYYARWYVAFDYHAINIEKLGYIIGGHNKIARDLNSLAENGRVSIDAPTLKLINTYFAKEKQLTIMLWALNVPIIIMLCLYLFMLSRLIIDRERNEISLLSSRGTTRIQIMIGYFIEGLILGGFAFLMGPWCGAALTKVLGASEGFLQFAKRKALPVQMNSEVYLYAALAVSLSIVTLLIPVYIASKTSIVSHKHKISRRSELALWEKFYMDFVLIALSAYGYFVFLQRQKIIKATGASATDIQVDPLLFLIPALFIIGIGLLILRIYPLIIKLIYFLGRRAWTPPLYATLTQVGRSTKSYHFLMVFLMMTLSIGIFCATAARTINLNAREKVYYGVGADMVLETLWENDAPKGGGSPAASSNSQNGSSGQSDLKPVKIQYFEPSFLPYTQLSGVEHATKVYTKDKAYISANDKSIEDVKVMGIEPYDFGNVAWFRNGLLKHHINDYLNLLSGEPSACLISSSISKQYNIKLGDSIQISWDAYDKAIFTVYGIVDYWPSWNPNIDPYDEKKMEPKLVVANLQYIQDHIAFEPYKVWLKLKPDATSKQVYTDIQNRKLTITSLEDANQKMLDVVNNPFQMAINGAMTLGFIICCFICFSGFLIYWVLSISSRTLQFGVFRAIGISVRQLMSMMVWEQLLTSGVAIVAGIVIGMVTSRLYVPFFQTAFDSYYQVPPFKVISFADDRIKIYILVGVTMTLGLGVLSLLISRIKVNQAIKLGEE